MTSGRAGAPRVSAAPDPVSAARGPAPAVLTRGTLVSVVVAVCVAQVALAIPAVLNGLFQQDPRPGSSPRRSPPPRRPDRTTGGPPIVNDLVTFRP